MGLDGPCGKICSLSTVKRQAVRNAHTRNVVVVQMGLPISESLARPRDLGVIWPVPLYWYVVGDWQSWTSRVFHGLALNVASGASVETF